MLSISSIKGQLISNPEFFQKKNETNRPIVLWYLSSTSLRSFLGRIEDIKKVLSKLTDLQFDFFLKIARFLQ